MVNTSGFLLMASLQVHISVFILHFPNMFCFLSPEVGHKIFQSFLTNKINKYKICSEGRGSGDCGCDSVWAAVPSWISTLCRAESQRGD